MTESPALQHAFSAERDAARMPPELVGAPLRRIDAAAVVGAGTMGQGIALVLAEAGIAVQLYDADAAVVARALAAIEAIVGSRVARGKLSASDAAAIGARIQSASAPESLRDADLAIEAVFEDLEVKRGVLQLLGSIMRADAVLATNTSYLDVDVLAQASGRASDVIGLHFFSPAHVMRLLEVVAGARTDRSVQATALALGKRLGKQTVLVGNARGFVGNRMMARRTREAYFLLEEGATPWQIDAAFTDFGFAMGPFAVADLAGLDIGWRNRHSQLDRLTPRERECTILDQLVAAGRLGQKAGRGFYRYDTERRGVPDSEVDALIERHARAVGRERKPVEAPEILRRCLFAMIDEAARILGEGKARRGSDIDVVWLHGYGFPRQRGGPLYYADQVGLHEVRAAILQWRDAFGADYWQVAPLLDRLATEGGRLSTWEPT
jgi:3-hydroxyacyl-CoA dehydrogenase